jgi:hypothetical protein
VILGDLGEHIAAITGEAALELPYAGKTYLAPQPGIARGVRCTQYLAAKTPQERAEILGEETLPDLTLTAAVVEQMDADDVPAAAIGTFALVALVAWVRGQKAAEEYVARLRSNTTGGEGSGEAASGSRSRKRTGTATASARRTRKPASGRTTGSRATS